MGTAFTQTSKLYVQSLGPKYHCYTEKESTCIAIQVVEVKAVVLGGESASWWSTTMLLQCSKTGKETGRRSCVEHVSVVELYTLEVPRMGH